MSSNTAYVVTIVCHVYWLFFMQSGYVGLVNQAMTCYLNSLLQTLYMTPEFRNAIYRSVTLYGFLLFILCVGYVG